MRLSRKSAATRAMPRCLVLRMVPCCLPHPKMHSTIARRDCDIALMPGGSFVDGAVAVLAGFGDGLVLCHMRRHADGAKIGDMIGGIVRLVLTGRDAAACGFASRLQHGLRSPAFGS